MIPAARTHQNMQQTYEEKKEVAGGGRDHMRHYMTMGSYIQTGGEKWGVRSLITGFAPGVFDRKSLKNIWRIEAQEMDETQVRSFTVSPLYWEVKCTQSDQRHTPFTPLLSMRAHGATDTRFVLLEHIKEHLKKPNTHSSFYSGILKSILRLGLNVTSVTLVCLFSLKCKQMWSETIFKNNVEYPDLNHSSMYLLLTLKKTPSNINFHQTFVGGAKEFHSKDP